MFDKVAHGARRAGGSRRRGPAGPPAAAAAPPTQSVFKVVLQKSISTQIRQLILFYYLYKEQVDGFVRESTFAQRLYKHFLRDKPGLLPVVIFMHATPSTLHHYLSQCLD